MELLRPDEALLPATVGVVFFAAFRFGGGAGCGGGRVGGVGVGVGGERGVGAGVGVGGRVG